jgi:RNA polymerase sigma factor (sigma-70 family)
VGRARSGNGHGPVTFGDADGTLSVDGRAERRRGSGEKRGRGCVRRDRPPLPGHGGRLQLRDAPRLPAAEDAAQEAFFEAYRTLPKLREPAAFAGWFRRIVFKHCDRITRRQAVVTVPLDTAAEPIQPRDEEERKAQVVEAMRHLPEHERSTMTLFYIGGYSMEEVATFLEVPVSTIKGRLHSARAAADDPRGLGRRRSRARRPSRNEGFATAVLDLLKRRTRLGMRIESGAAESRPAAARGAGSDGQHRTDHAAVNSGHDALAGPVR